jgi:ADP-ribose pyrophosphatase YjhB (NUDIX family)
MPESPKHSVSVAGIVVNSDGHVLVIRRADNGHWEPPGGVLELDESFEHGVIREIKEETGIHVTVDRLTGVYKNMPRGIVALVFRCTPQNEKPRTSDEATSVRWADPSEVADLMDPAYAVRITDALDNAAPVTRAHNGVDLVNA